MSSMVPPFSLTAPRYDMSTYWGRVRYFMDVVDPRMCLVTASTVLANRAVLNEYKRDPTAVKESDAQLWERRKVIDACWHRPTQSVIPNLLRMSAFMPVNFFIVPFMMLPSTVASIGRTAFIHWANQSYNAAINYANRSSDKLSVARLLLAYGLAVGISTSVALSATMLVRRLGTSPYALIARTVLPFTAVVASSSANVAAMRTAEWYSEGIDVTDDDGCVRGRSLDAGRLALEDCFVARVLWNVPSMLAPPLIAAPLIATVPFLRRHALSFETSVVIAGLALGVVPAMAVYPQERVVDVARLESKFQHLTDREGRPIQTLTYVRGM